MIYSTVKKPSIKVGVDVIPIKKKEVDRYWGLLKLMIIQGLDHVGGLLSEADLKAMQADPKYWKDKDQAFIQKVRSGFNKLALKKHGTLVQQ